MTRTHTPRPPLGILAVIALIAGLLLAVTAPNAEPADAASASDFDPGYIIDDQIFYDSTAMSAVEIQSFLNARVSSCRSGYTCLKDYGQVTDSRPADRYCNGYTGGSWQSAAQIIDNVARSCGISQRVLLVLLEKEQSLVTSRSPGSWAYTAATGQGCPDTAPCDPATSGFFYQVYYAARQYEVYRLNPTLFGYREQRWNNILYNPDRNCGTKSVFIHNQATAALYIYTPYTPNTAALNNLYGEGDGCSSYGNRNFWRIFTDWFGDPKTYTVHPGLVPFWQANGGATGPIGVPTGYPVYLEANGQGWYQRFSGGNVYGSFQGGSVFVPNNAILTEYNRLGGPSSSLGWPNGAQACASAGRCTQSFAFAEITATPQWGAHAITGGYLSYWRDSGGFNGSLGPALNDLAYQTPAAGPGWVQHFQNAVLVQTPQAYTVMPYSSITDAWYQTGAGPGWLSWPRTAQTCDGYRCSQEFVGGVVTSTTRWGAYTVSGGFLTAWHQSGGMQGFGSALNPLRYTDASGGGWVQNYEAGVVAQSRTGGVVLVPYGPDQVVWTNMGAERSALGFPVDARTCTSGTCVQNYQGGLVASTNWGSYALSGALNDAWKAAGGLPAIGVPINAERTSKANGGGLVQHFISGVITARTGQAGVYTPYGPILNMWYYYGAEATWLGWPSASPTCGADGACMQQFQNGIARSDAAGRVSFAKQ